MRWTSLEEWRRRFAIPYQRYLPPEGHHPQEAVDGVVAAGWHKPGYACLRLTPVQEDQPTDVQRDQGKGSRACCRRDPEAAQLLDDLQRATPALEQASQKYG
jgi:hypothetical protein